MSARLLRASRALALLAAVTSYAAFATEAAAQSGFFASIAYSQSTGRVGYSARQARTRNQADALALRMCAAPDAKVFMWARDQWVAAAVVDGHVGTAGFGRGMSAEEAQRNALAETAKRARNNGYRVVLCVHSGGQRVPDEQLSRVAAKPAPSRTGFYAALAFSPSTGKIGVSTGKAKTIDEAKQLAVADVGAPDAKVFMWGDQWVAIAIAPDKPGVAGFGPGDTREAAEKAALAQATKYAGGAAVRVERAVYSTGEENPVVPAAATGPVPTPATGPSTVAPPAAPAGR
jgi:ribosomal protein S5